MSRAWIVVIVLAVLLVGCPLQCSLPRVVPNIECPTIWQRIQHHPIWHPWRLPVRPDHRPRRLTDENRDWDDPSDPFPEFPVRVGPDGGIDPLTPAEFKQLQDWLKRHPRKTVTR